MKTTVLLPAYNEAENLPDLLLALHQTLRSTRDGDYEIILVDDGSTDDTAAIAEASAVDGPVRLIRHHRNQGLGGTLRTGLTAACRNDGVVVTMDADNSHDPGCIVAMVAAIEDGNELVIASRFQEGGAMVGVPWHRRLLSVGASRFMNLVFPTAGVRDFSTGFRAYDAGLLRRVIDHFGEEFITQDGFASMVEVLLRARAVGARMFEVPFVLRYDRKRGESKMNISRTILGYLRLARELSIGGRGQKRRGAPQSS